MLGLKRGTVSLCKHEESWETEAEKIIYKLKTILGTLICDIQHIGSTSVPSIMAKPIIDIAIATDDFAKILTLEAELQEEGFYYRPNEEEREKHLLFACGSFYDGTGDLQTHFIHVVKADGMEWLHYLNFRNLLRTDLILAREYEALKISLAQQFHGENGRKDYLQGKHDFIAYHCRKALVRSFLGKKVDIRIDRPIGSIHPKHPDLLYPINYGYLPGIFVGDGEELDVYLLGVFEPMEEFTAKIIGIVHRKNDDEDKLVAVPENLQLSKEDIASAVHFQEQYFQSEIEMLPL